MKRCLGFLVGMAFCGSVFGGVNSSLVHVTNIESRDSGHHAVYVDGDIPSQGCTHETRAIIVEGSSGANTMISIAMMALASQLRVQIKVEGCVAIQPEAENTSPKIVKVQVFR